MSYNVGLLLYGKYTALDNRRAIQYFEHALSTPNEALKARAYAGLADAYSQNYQRWKSDDRDDLRRARRCARFAWELGARNRAANPAAIAKAYAYTNFALSTVESEPESERSAREQEAESYYRKAIDHDHRFAVAYNNLGFLYLQRAKMIAQSPVARGGLKGAALGSTGSDLAALRRDLREARHNFEKAVEADSQYPHAYDNLGNVCLAEIDLCDQPHQEALRLDEAERWFHYAVGLDPTYAAAYQDIALLDLRRAWGSDCRSDASLFNVRDGFAFHVKALSALHAEVRPRFCSDMQSNLSRLPLSAGEILSSVHEALREELQNVGCECVRQLSRQELEAV